jgi:hypothetical protein
MKTVQSLGFEMHLHGIGASMIAREIHDGQAQA